MIINFAFVIRLDWYCPDLPHRRMNSIFALRHFSFRIHRANCRQIVVQADCYFEQTSDHKDSGEPDRKYSVPDRKDFAPDRKDFEPDRKDSEPDRKNSEEQTDCNMYSSWRSFVYFVHRQWHLQSMFCWQLPYIRGYLQ